MKNTILHKANTRGHADHGWLNAHHTFSFASYYDPNRVQFGMLRVLNDDIVAAGMGFGTHPHDNMEIITIPLEGDLAHKDSMGNTEVMDWLHGESTYTVAAEPGTSFAKIQGKMHTNHKKTSSNVVSFVYELNSY